VEQTTHLHLVPRSKNAWSYISTDQYAFMAYCSVRKKAQGQIYLCLLPSESSELVQHLRFSLVFQEYGFESLLHKVIMRLSLLSPVLFERGFIPFSSQFVAYKPLVSLDPTYPHQPIQLR